jgi:hypothetical protein
METALEMIRMDTDFGLFVERQLEHVRSKSYDVKHRKYRIREFVPVDNTVNPGAETVSYMQYDWAGQAKLISSYAQDLPRAEVKGKEFRGAVKGMGISYGYSVQELRAAKMAGTPLDAKKANAAMNGFERTVDDIGFSGDSENGLQGLNSITNALTHSPATKAATGTVWAVATGLEMYNDLVSLAGYSMSQTHDVEQPDTIILPSAQYELANQTLLNPAGSANTTVLAAFLANNPFIKQVAKWEKLAGAGATATDRAICYRKDPDALQLVIPLEMVQHPAQPEGLEFVVPCEGRIGGVVCYYPLSVTYMDGI